MVGKTLVYIFFACLGLLFITFLLEVPFALFGFLIFVIIWHFFKKNHQYKVAKKRLLADGFVPTKSFEFMPGEGMLIDENSKKIALIGDNEVFVCLFEEKPVLSDISVFSNNKGKVLNISFSVKFTQKTTGFCYKKCFSSALPATYSEIELFWSEHINSKKSS